MTLTRLEREQIESSVRNRSRIPATELRRARSDLPRDELELLQRAAREHPNAKVRRECLGVLDHHANDASSEVFRAVVLFDPVPHVRVIALHGLACERCRVGALCVEDTVTDLIHVLDTDENARVRHEAVLVIARLGRRDPRVLHVLTRIARDDADPLVRTLASAAVDGRGRDVRSRKALRRRERAVAGRLVGWTHLPSR
jgi:hypothetical protein